MTLEKKKSRYIYADGSRSTVQIVLDATISIGFPASQHEIYKRVVSDIPDFKETNMFPDLSTLTVNCNSRSNYSGNKKARRTDEGNQLDRLFRVEVNKEARYEIYDPVRHGVWELASDGKGKLRPKLVEQPVDRERAQAINDIEQIDGWLLHEDARRQVMALIVRREGQPAFRRSLLDAYERTCAISGCEIEVLLEAAHIVPYKGEHTNHASNGLLLRADLHKLFDLHLISIDPQKRNIHLHESLNDSEYAQLAGRKLRAPTATELAPGEDALTHHFQRCMWWMSKDDPGRLA